MNREARRGSSKMLPWVVVCSRPGYLPQVIGAFAERANAETWVRRHCDKWPQWEYSTARLALTPTAPIRHPGAYPLQRLRLKQRLPKLRHRERSAT